MGKEVSRQQSLGCATERMADQCPLLETGILRADGPHSTHFPSFGKAWHSPESGLAAYLRQK